MWSARARSAARKETHFRIWARTQAGSATAKADPCIWTLQLLELARLMCQKQIWCLTGAETSRSAGHSSASPSRLSCSVKENLARIRSSESKISILWRVVPGRPKLSRRPQFVTQILGTRLRITYRRLWMSETMMLRIITRLKLWIIRTKISGPRTICKSTKTRNWDSKILICRQ